MLIETETYLGPASVVETVADRVRVALPSGEAWARLALAYPYEPAPGDVVLLIGQEEHYIIGVLLGRGQTLFKVPGDLRLEARSVEISGAEAIRLTAPEVALRAGTLRIVARSVRERFGTAWRWVRGSFHSKAGRTRTVVDGTHRVLAGAINQKARGDVKIDGRQIKLG